MSVSSAELALQLRQQLLLLRSAELRVDLAEQAGVLHRPLAVADQARLGVQWMRAHPLAPAAALLLLALLRPRRVLRWSLLGWAGWRRWRGLQRWLQAAPRGLVAPAVRRPGG